MGWFIKTNTDGTREPVYEEEEQTVIEPKPVRNEPVWKEFHKIDMNTGERLDVLLIDIANEEVPEDCKEGWSQDYPFYNAKWDLTLNKWIEGADLSLILEPLRKAKVEQLNNDCQVAIHKGFEYNGDFFQFNDKDQANFNQQLSLLLLDSTITEVQWKTENNGVKIFPKEVFIQACKAGEVHKRNNIGRYWQLKNHVLTYDFTTVEELQSITFDTVIGTNTDTETVAEGVS
jgi:hypothetical protein